MRKGMGADVVRGELRGELVRETVDVGETGSRRGTWGSWSVWGEDDVAADALGAGAVVGKDANGGKVAGRAAALWPFGRPIAWPLNSMVALV